VGRKIFSKFYRKIPIRNPGIFLAYVPPPPFIEIGNLPKGANMQPTDFDSIILSSAEDIEEHDVHVAAQEAERQIQGRAWNMNQPLNMIAYEDQP
jgi:hypothetical protein